MADSSATTIKNNTVFVLVRPEFLGNIGSAARALKNFGLKNLRLVCPPKNYKDAEARKMCVGAFDILKTCDVAGSLSEALQDVEFAIGSTSLRQRNQQAITISGLLPDWPAERKVAVIFGNERDGLSNSELQQCHCLTTIPTNPDFPALNMAQSVAIYAYEIARMAENAAPATSKPAAGESYATGSEDEQTIAQLELLLDQIGFLRSHNRNKVLAELRSFYRKARPTSRENGLLRGALYKINQRIKEHESQKLDQTEKTE